MLKNKKPAFGFYCIAASLIFSILAFITYLFTFDAFHYSLDRWVTALMIIAFWCLGCMTVTSFISGNEPHVKDIFYVITAFALTLAAIKFLIPCLSPIGIYFTVHNMGDVEANAIGVPRSIICLVFFVLAIISLLVSSFSNVVKKEVGKK